MRGRARRAAGESEVNLTPMLDVVFILLIFFIVTSNFIQEDALAMEPPAPDTGVTANVQTIMIHIDSDSLITINGRLSDIGAVRAGIERIKAEVPDAALIIRADAAARNGTVILVRDAAYSAGFDAAGVQLSAKTPA